MALKALVYIIFPTRHVDLPNLDGGPESICMHPGLGSGSGFLRKPAFSAAIVQYLHILADRSLQASIRHHDKIKR